MVMGPVPRGWVLRATFPFTLALALSLSVIMVVTFALACALAFAFALASVWVPFALARACFHTDASFKVVW